MNSLNQAKLSKKLVTSQRQAVIKLLEKKNKDKRLISNWKLISLLNVDFKIISKIFASRLKKVLLKLISSQRTAYFAQRCINESRRLISDLLNSFTHCFDSLDHTFLISALEKFGFGKTFIDLIKIFLNDQDSCVINGEITTKYFKLEKGARQGDPISPYLFLLCLEILKLYWLLMKFWMGSFC